ncbi:hypothetical protein LTR35_009690 [Friedmanniomyces endolithicus]|uniref:Transcription factor CBF/NF-Y/archaeal histone domain-containing protein n=1 Tax=Friedmanniomyces endolithicus TaxID=329885 RepID=A0AAN6J904_9PEZI|nr:hypothetical protein LTR35_009690 [Friedmanniomyces endolithicus]KAK0301104.1 hypothetical protein LTS00_000253 [Friedmanniomyces endolithicus]KAK0321308.1 hypothetical protein LTR82_007760 [Friedmanniomyces endolithicus]KAK1018818.1 hypothetical protein LTR54_000629 [Friedmanniomyces endolithicus]
MPYNNTPITPTRDITGTVSLPLARVKKIINADDDVGNCSNNAAFVITAATEMFLQYLVEQSYNIVKSERKPRRNVQYRDVANAVARVENLEFLADVVPKTTTYKAVKQKSAKDGTAAAPNGGLANGQGTLDGHMGGAQDRAEAQATKGAAHDKMDIDVGDEQTSEDTVDEDKEATQSPPERKGHDGMEV